MKKMLLTLMVSSLVLASCKQPESDVTSNEQSFTLSAPTAVLEANKSTTVTVTPVGFTGIVIVKSDMIAVATASVTGNTITITGVAAGNAKITVTTPDGKFSNTITVAVSAEVIAQSFTLSTETVLITGNGTGTVTVTPEGFTGPVTTQPSNEGIATASVAGNVITIKGVTAGDTTITVTTPDGKFDKTIAVDVGR